MTTPNKLQHFCIHLETKSTAGFCFLFCSDMSFYCLPHEIHRAIYRYKYTCDYSDGHITNQSKEEFFYHPHTWGAYKPAMPREAAFQHLRSTWHNLLIVCLTYKLSVSVKSCGLAFITQSLLLCQTAAILMSLITAHKMLHLQPSTSYMQLN